MTTGFEASLLVFLVGLLVGGFAVHVGSVIALTSQDYGHALVTAVLGALAWAIVDVGLDELGASGWFASLAGLIVWAWVVRQRYEVGWTRAAIIGLGAWLAALVALAVLSLVGIDQLDAYGVPGA